LHWSETAALRRDPYCDPRDGIDPVRPHRTGRTTRLIPQKPYALDRQIGRPLGSVLARAVWRVVRQGVLRFRRLPIGNRRPGSDTTGRTFQPYDVFDVNLTGVAAARTDRAIPHERPNRMARRAAGSREYPKRRIESLRGSQLLVGARKGSAPGRTHGSKSGRSGMA
jgi:hypothetical protein